MGLKKSTEVSPFLISKMKLTEESRANYILLIKYTHNPLKFA